MKIIHIMGKSSSGKDTIYKIIKEKLDLNTYVLYTTRPMRTGEKDGIDYNFITFEKMQELKTQKDSKVIESRQYNTVYGIWEYATIEDEQFDKEKDMLMIGTLESYNKLKAYFDKIQGKEIIPIYIEVEDGIRLERALKREKEQNQPKYTELCRRFLADSKDFSEENIKKAGIEKRFQNIELERCVEEIVEYLNE